jgi:hypothetical protein
LGRGAAANGRLVFTRCNISLPVEIIFHASVVPPKAQEGCWRGVPFGHTAKDYASLCRTSIPPSPPPGFARCRAI